MASPAAVAELKATLRREVTDFCASGRGLWRSAARETLLQLHERGWHSVLFGGTPRSLLWSRLYRGRPGRPRDIDVVVRDIDVDALRAHLHKVVRETRFGGLKVERGAWHFDVWPLHATWMFSVDHTLDASFEMLPYTTAFNLEAIAVEVWPEKKGLPRVVFSGDDQFFEGIADRLLELNREQNPFPELTVVRALLLAQALEFDVGTRLASFIAKIGPKISSSDLTLLQVKHYGGVRQEADVLQQLVEHVDGSLQRDPAARVRIPVIKQLNLFEEERKKSPTLRAFSIG